MKKKPQPHKPSGPRNPFAGRPRGGAGFHSEVKYGKKNRRLKKKELEEEAEEGPEEDPQDG